MPATYTTAQGDTGWIPDPLTETTIYPRAYWSWNEHCPDGLTTSLLACRYLLSQTMRRVLISTGARPFLRPIPQLIAVPANPLSEGGDLTHILM